MRRSRKMSPAVYREVYGTIDRCHKCGAILSAGDYHDCGNAAARENVGEQFCAPFHCRKCLEVMRLVLN